MHPRIYMNRFCFRALAQQVLGSNGCKKQRGGWGRHTSLTSSRGPFFPAYYFQAPTTPAGYHFFNNCDHICQQTMNFTVECDSSAAWQTCCNTVFSQDGSGGMYLWRHTSEHQQVIDFVIAFLNNAEIGRNGYWSGDINLQSKKVCGLFIFPTGLIFFLTVEVTIQPWLKNAQSAA